MSEKDVQSPGTVFVVDDDDDVRDALELLLLAEGLPSRSFAGAADFLEAYEPSFSGCLVLDVRMPGMSGLELQERLRERAAVLPILFVTGHGDVPMAVRALRAGAFDFLEKPYDDQELLDRVREALEIGGRARRNREERAAVRRRLDTLTPRETEVMELVVEGCANKVVAGRLQLSQRTVEIHRAKVMEKMQASSLAHLVRMVMLARGETGVG